MNDWNASHPGEERGSSGDAACPKLIPRRRSSESCASPAVAHDHTSHNTASIHTSEHNPPSSRSTSSVWSSQAEGQCGKERKTHCWSSMAGDDDHLRIQDEQNPPAHPTRIPPPCQRHLT